MSEKVSAVGYDTQDAESTGILAKLILFAVALAVVPLAVYYGTLNALWKGDSTFAAISAVLAANAVLGLYIFQSVREDKLSRMPAAAQQHRKVEETRKDR